MQKKVICYEKFQKKFQKKFFKKVKTLKSALKSSKKSSFPIKSAFKSTLKSTFGSSEPYSCETAAAALGTTFYFEPNLQRCYAANRFEVDVEFNNTRSICLKGKTGQPSGNHLLKHTLPHSKMTGGAPVVRSDKRKPD